MAENNYDLDYTGSMVDRILDTGYDLQNQGYIFRGLASHFTGTPTERTWLIAPTGSTGFGLSSPVPPGSIGICMYNGSSWSAEVLNTLTLDSAPTSGSGNGITSGAVKTLAESITNAIGQLEQSVSDRFTSLELEDTTGSLQAEVLSITLKYVFEGEEETLTSLSILAATAEKAGLMSAADKQKLDAFVTNIRSLRIQDTTAQADQGTELTNTLKWTIGGVTEAITAFTLYAATTSKAGLMSAADKTALDTLPSLINAGYLYAGIATPSTVPSSTSAKIYYIAIDGGTYTNFGNLNVTQGINIIYKSGDAWSVAQVVGIDNEPTAGSDNLVKSGGVKTELALGAVYDVSAHHNGATFESLSALLSDTDLNALIPTAVRKGGVSIKFVQSSDNKYIQARCMAQNFTTDVAYWQGVDEKPLTDSKNLAESGGVAKAVNDAIRNSVGNVVIDQWYRGLISSTTGKFSALTKRVTNKYSITENVKVVCSSNSDIYIRQWFKFKQGANPFEGGTNGTDFVVVNATSAQRKSVVINYDEAFPELYLIFSNSDVDADILPSEVDANVSIMFQDADNVKIKQRLTAAEETLAARKNEPIAESTDLITSGGVEAFMFHQYYTKNLAASSSQQQIKLREFDYGKNVAARIVSNTATLGTDGKIYIRFKDTNNVNHYSVLSSDWILMNADAGTVFTEMYSYSSGTVSTAGVIKIEIVFKDGYDAIFGVDGLDREVYGDTPKDLGIVQGTYGDGIPSSSETTRCRINRMILREELPITIIIPDDSPGVLYNLYKYDTANDYTSFDGYLSLGSYKKKVYITQDMIGSAAAITVNFRNEGGYNESLLQADMKDTIIAKGDSVGLAEEVNVLNKTAKTIGNSEYYGRIQTLKITDEVHKLKVTEKVAHIYSEYSHTVFNQSLAIWDDKYFCFNDTSRNDGFCVIIDMSTNEILEFVTTIPQELGSSHLNNAQFTNIFYTPEDKYPLLILSRGDYARPNQYTGGFHVFRITEESNHFVFTHIKKVVEQDRYGLFNTSYCYDRDRNMIWAYTQTQDWRYNNSAYNNFLGSSPVPVMADSDYICITSGKLAASVNSEITITIGEKVGGSNIETTRTVSLNAGESLNEVFAYNPYTTGFVTVKVAQSASAFASSAKWIACECDSNGNNLKEIVCNAILCGFACPDLLDSNQASLIENDIITKTIMDFRIFQGADYANGKLFMPTSGSSNYRTINWQPTSYLGHACLVVDPLSGYVETIIPSGSSENEGCAIYNGKLYISSHEGDATPATTKPCFTIVEYDFS